MEEKKQPLTQPVQPTKKLTYEELQHAASELHTQYQKLAQEYQKVVAALNNRQFDYMSFLLQMLFKVMEHPEMYTQEFVRWASSNIEDSLNELSRSIASSFETGEDSESKDNHADEAE